VIDDAVDHRVDEAVRMLPQSGGDRGTSPHSVNSATCQSSPRAGCVGDRGYGPPMRVEGVDDAAIAEASAALLESIDVLLDRLSHRVQQSPRPGSRQWRHQWDCRNTPSGQVSRRRHILVRLAIAAEARLAVDQEIAAAVHASASRAELAAASGLPSVTGTRIRKRPPTGDEMKQLAIW
jgi:hypothetical protein